MSCLLAFSVFQLALQFKGWVEINISNVLSAPRISEVIK